MKKIVNFVLATLSGSIFLSSFFLAFKIALPELFSYMSSLLNEHPNLKIIVLTIWVAECAYLSYNSDPFREPDEDHSQFIDLILFPIFIAVLSLLASTIIHFLLQWAFSFNIPIISGAAAFCVLILGATIDNITFHHFKFK